MTARSICAALALAAEAAALHSGAPWLGFANYRATSDDRPAPLASSKIKAYNLSVPIDHFHNETKYEPHSDDFFNLRYWLDTTHYKKGGPVIILHSGEFDSDFRLPFLEHGIVPILAEATGGVGIVLEHRYYGTSWPTKDATVENLRFLTTDQAIADTAYFSKHVKIPGLEHLDLTAPKTPHILYGGSYAGGFVAIARKLYPEVFWGAISSSGVTVAIDDLWQYFEAARHFSPGRCSPAIQRLTEVIDTQLLSGNKDKESNIKGLFGLQDLWNDEFAGVLMNVMASLQSTNWDPKEDTADFGTFCAVITSPYALFSSTGHLEPRVRKAVAEAGFDDSVSKRYTNEMLNYIGYVRDQVKKYRAGQCKGTDGLRECLSVRFQKDRTDIGAGWTRSWLYQTCTE